MYEEAGALLEYFQEQQLENLPFYHVYQMDMEEQNTTIFQANVRMLIGYSYFGDMISLNITHSTNRGNRPLALFYGFNHLRGLVIFRVVLLYDEIVESFKWLFETFLTTHNQRKPFIVFTNQDQAVVKALHKVMPKALHGLYMCI